MRVLALLGFSVFACQSVLSASLSYTRTSDAFAVFVDAQEHNDNFETIFFQAEPTSPAVFTNPATGNVGGLPRPPGDPFTYMNRMLTAHPLDSPDAFGLSLFELVNTPNELRFLVTRFGGIISTAAQPGGDLFLANINLPAAGASAIVTVQLLGRADLSSNSR